MIAVYDVILQNQVIKGLFDFMSKGLSRQANVLPTLVVGI